MGGLDLRSWVVGVMMGAAVGMMLAGGFSSAWQANTSQLLEQRTAENERLKTALVDHWRVGQAYKAELDGLAQLKPLGERLQRAREIKALTTPADQLANQMLAGR